MPLAKVFNAACWTAETIKGAAVTLASPNAPIPKTDLHPRMMARPFTAQEYVRFGLHSFL